MTMAIVMLTMMAIMMNMTMVIVLLIATLIISCDGYVDYECYYYGDGDSDADGDGDRYGDVGDYHYLRLVE